MYVTDFILINTENNSTNLIISNFNKVQLIKLFENFNTMLHEIDKNFTNPN
jgi:hypothetical protein